MASNIPGNLTAPLVTFDVQSAGNFESEARLLLQGFVNAVGAGLAVNTPALVTSRAMARALCGAGSMLETMYLYARRNAPSHEIWIEPIAEVGTAEVRTITVDDVPAGGGQGVIAIAGLTVSVSIAAGATATEVATALAAAINAYYDPLTGLSLPFTAASAAEVVTITARHKGTYATGIDIDVPVIEGSNGFSGNLTVATTTPGAGAVDVSAALAALTDDPFDMIVTPFNDATNLGVYRDFLSEVLGRWSYAQQIYGHVLTAKTDTSGNLTTYSAALDTWHLTTVPRLAGGGNGEPDYVWAAAFAGRVAPLLASGADGRVSANQTGLTVEGLTPPRDRSSWLDYATRDAFLKNGLSTWRISTGGDVQVDKLITHVQTGEGGAPDTTFRDIQKPFQLMYGLAKMRAAIAYEHSNKAIRDDNPTNLEAISTPADVKATLVHTYLENPGVFEGADQIIPLITIERDLDNPNRLNGVLPLDLVNPLDIFAGLAKVYSQYR